MLAITEWLRETFLNSNIDAWSPLHFMQPIYEPASTNFKS